MTIAHDQATQSSTFTTVSPFTFTHTPLNTPSGVLVLIAQDDVDTDTVTAVTYGGVAMTLVTTAADVAGKPRRSYVYVLNSSVPTGTQTVSITHGGLSADKWAVAATITAAGDTEIGSIGIIEGDMTSPRIALNSGSTFALRYCVNSSGGSTATWTQLSGMTALFGKDWGATSARVDRETVASSGTFTIGYTIGSKDVAMVAVAIQEAVAPPPPPPPPPPPGSSAGQQLLVVSVDAPAELQTGDFVCDGIADQIQINAAILAAAQLAARGGPAGGQQRSTVLLTGGRFNINAPILMRTGVTLQGSGLLTEIRAVSMTATGMIMSFVETLHMSLVRDLWLNGNYGSGGATASGVHYVSVAGGNMPEEPPAGNDPKNRIESLLISGFTNNANRHGIYLDTDLRGCRIIDVYMRDIGGNGVWFVNSPDSHLYHSSIGTVGGRGAYVQGANNSIANCKFYYCDIAGVESTSGYVKISNVEVQDSLVGFRLAGSDTTANGLLADTCDTTGIEIAASGLVLEGFTIAHRTGGRYANMDTGLVFTGSLTNLICVGRIDTTNITTRHSGTTSGAGNFIRVTGNSALLAVG